MLNGLIGEQRGSMFQHVLEPVPPRRLPSGSFIDSVHSFGDWLLSALKARPFIYLGVVVAVLVVISGAIFFFILVGWDTIESEKTRNSTENVSIQILSWCFTYFCLYLFPGRIANFVGLFGYKGALVYRIGYDHNSEVSSDPFDWIPWGHRFALTVLFILNSVFQFINQSFRIIYMTYKEANTWPGLLWVNLFFGLSFMCGISAGIYNGVQESKARKLYEGQFDAPPPEQAYRYLKSLVSSVILDDDEEEDGNSAQEDSSDPEEDTTIESEPAVRQGLWKEGEGNAI